MSPTKTLREREDKLRVLIATAPGRDEIEALAAGYCAKSGKSRPPRTSAITYILVHERSKGLIRG